MIRCCSALPARCGCLNVVPGPEPRRAVDCDVASRPAEVAIRCTCENKLAPTTAVRDFFAPRCNRKISTILESSPTPGARADLRCLVNQWLLSRARDAQMDNRSTSYFSRSSSGLNSCRRGGGASSLLSFSIDKTIQFIVVAGKEPFQGVLERHFLVSCYFVFGFSIDDSSFAEGLDGRVGRHPKIAVSLLPIFLPMRLDIR